MSVVHSATAGSLGTAVISSGVAAMGAAAGWMVYNWIKERLEPSDDQKIDQAVRQTRNIYSDQIQYYQKETGDFLELAQST